MGSSTRRFPITSAWLGENERLFELKSSRPEIHSVTADNIISLEHSVIPIPERNSPGAEVVSLSIIVETCWS